MTFAEDETKVACVQCQIVFANDTEAMSHKTSNMSHQILKVVNSYFEFTLSNVDKDKEEIPLKWGKKDNRCHRGKLTGK